MDLAFAPEVRDPRVRQPWVRAAAARRAGDGHRAPSWPKRVAASGSSRAVDRLVSRRPPVILNQIDEGPLARRMVRGGLKNRERHPWHGPPYSRQRGLLAPEIAAARRHQIGWGGSLGGWGLGGMRFKATRSGVTNA
jgi:hypothetical protein